MNIVMFNICQGGESVPFFILPTPRKYHLVYRNKRGQQNEYTISNPIEFNENALTAYAFGRGIRSFIPMRIVSIKPL